MTPRPRFSGQAPWRRLYVILAPIPLLLWTGARVAVMSTQGGGRVGRSVAVYPLLAASLILSGVLVVWGIIAFTIRAARGVIDPVLALALLIAGSVVVYGSITR